MSPKTQCPSCPFVATSAVSMRAHSKTHQTHVLLKPKVCSCGHVWNQMPMIAKISDDAVFGGAYWECVCKSTLFVRLKEVV